MRIAFDLRWIRGEQIDGISRYAISLISHLLQAKTAHEYVLIGDQRVLSRHLPLSAFSSATIVAIPQALLSIQDFLFTPREIQRLRVDIFHSPNYLTSPFGKHYRKIITVHDLIPLLFPEALAKSRLLWRLFYKTPYLISFILRSADRIITPSKHTKHDIVRLLNIPSENIQVVWEGLEEQFHPNYHVSDQFFQRYTLPRRFMLYVGRQDPYKGLSYLVQAYALLPASLRQTYKLVLAGKIDARYTGDVKHLVEKFQLQQEVIFLDYVPDADLPLIYSAAALLVHPSFYEGFGLTPLEAMACGTPVVYADTSSLTEILGDAGFAVSPESAEALAKGIRKMLENERLRQAFSEKGIQHVQRYTWPEVAQEVLKIYEEPITL